MKAFWEWVDTFGGPALLFVLAYGIFLFGVLWIWKRTRPTDEVCDRCGRTWERTGRGAEVHFCAPPRRNADVLPGNFSRSDSGEVELRRNGTRAS